MTSSIHPQSAAIADLVGRQTVVPVLTIEDAARAVPLGRALVKGGLRVLEITLRTSAALAAIERMAAELPDAVIGAGTVVYPAQLARAARVGARFAVSPGATPELLTAAAAQELPFLPGAATASEAMTLLVGGWHFLKFFPAEPAGGVPLLKSLREPLPQLRFCPTGGIDVAEGQGISGAAQCRLRRRLLGGTARGRGGRGLGADRGAGGSRPSPASGLSEVMRGPFDVLATIRGLAPTLSRAERRVAEAVLAATRDRHAIEHQRAGSGRRRK